MSSSEGPFKIVYPAPVQQKFKTAYRQAKAAGKLERFKAAALEMEHRLRSDPHGFGELKSVLKSIGATMQIAFSRPLMVEFGIHDETRVVIVKRLEIVTSLEMND